MIIKLNKKSYAIKFQTITRMLNIFFTGIFFILFSKISYGQQDNTADKSASVVKIESITKPSIGIVGNSTIAAYAGGEAIATLMNKTSAFSITDIAVPGYTIHQEDSLWRRIPIDIKQSLNYVFVEIGLNDLKPEEPASEALSRYQSLINLIRSETNKSCKIITSTMTPLRQRLIYLYGNKKGLISYKKWLKMNKAMMGMGHNKIINFDSYCNSHTNALNDGKGNLAASYDTGDGTHETTKARQIIANEWVGKVVWYMTDEKDGKFIKRKNKKVND